MSEPDGMMEVIFSDIDSSMFSIRYAPSHLKCPKGCVPTMWVGWTAIKVEASLWTAQSVCYTCSTAWRWTMHPDKPLNKDNVALLPCELPDDDGKGDAKAPDDNR